MTNWRKLASNLSLLTSHAAAQLADLRIYRLSNRSMVLDQLQRMDIQRDIEGSASKKLTLMSYERSKVACLMDDSLTSPNVLKMIRLYRKQLGSKSTNASTPTDAEV